MVAMISKVSRANCHHGFSDHDNRYINKDCGISQIPTDIPADALRTDLPHNGIDEIEIGVFSHLKACIALGAEQQQPDTSEAWNVRWAGGFESAGFVPQPH